MLTLAKYLVVGNINVGTCFSDKTINSVYICGNSGGNEPVLRYGVAVHTVVDSNIFCLTLYIQ